jgi:transposase
VGRGALSPRQEGLWSAAASLGIQLLPLPGYSPNLMAVEPLWRWLREDVTYITAMPRLRT